MNTAQIEALLALLSDEDEDILQHVKSKLKENWAAAISPLEAALATNDTPLFQKRGNKLLVKLYLRRTLEALNSWKNSEKQDLVEASIILSRFLYPKMDTQDLYNQIAKLKKDVWLEMSDEFTPLEKVHILNHVLFKIYKFNNKTQNLFAPQNNQLSHLLNERSGNAVILSILYLEIAQSLNMPIFGISIPDNFILTYLKPNQLKKDGEALFYINPNTEGTIFQKDVIEAYLKEYDIPSENYFFEPCNNTTVIRRLIMQYISSCESAGDFNTSKHFKRFLKAI